MADHLTGLVQIEHRRFIIVRVGKQVRRVEITGCFWCGTVDGHICAACGAKADELRKQMRGTDGE